MQEILLKIGYLERGFESGKCGKENEKLQKFENLKNEKSFLDEKKKHFTDFEGLSFGEIIKI